MTGLDAAKKRKLDSQLVSWLLWKKVEHMFGGKISMLTWTLDSGGHVG